MKFPHIAVHGVFFVKLRDVKSLPMLQKGRKMRQDSKKVKKKHEILPQ